MRTSLSRLCLTSFLFLFAGGIVSEAGAQTTGRHSYCPGGGGLPGGGIPEGGGFPGGGIIPEGGGIIPEGGGIIPEGGGIIPEGGGLPGGTPGTAIEIIVKIYVPGAWQSREFADLNSARRYHTRLRQSGFDAQLRQVGRTYRAYYRRMQVQYRRVNGPNAVSRALALRNSLQRQGMSVQLVRRSR